MTKEIVIRMLIEKWRVRALLNDGDDRKIGLAQRQCADELETILGKAPQMTSEWTRTTMNDVLFGAQAKTSQLGKSPLAGPNTKSLKEKL